MNLRNIYLVCRRELQDQLRDRRTLFMVAVLPLLMYPLMGASFFQLSQFMRGHTAQVLVFGADQLEEVTDLPPLIEENRFSSTLFSPKSEARRIQLTYANAAEVTTEARRDLSAGKMDVIVVFPAGFAEQLAELRNQLQNLRSAEGNAAAGLAADIRVPQPAVLFNSLRESSRVAQLRVDRVLARWQDRIKRKNLADSGVPAGLTRPFQIAETDVAQGRGRFVGLWSVLLPFVMFVWALTGAFYPATDLCAGEKERGTLETLLSSPASRNDIVWGKLLTVMIFCMATATLNLAGMAITSQFIAGQLGSIGGAQGLTAPPFSSLLCLLVALPPLAALFSALSLACASFARSTKEGQYYFMPLFLALLPLMMIPMAPGVELNLGNSLVPVMGLVLVLQAMLEQRVAEALPYVLPVTIVTLGCCVLAIQWAVSQFNQESVLFRESERFDLRLWLARAIRDRQQTPTAGLAVLAVGLIFVLQFFANSGLSQLGLEPGAGLIVVGVLVSQACVLLPPLVLALFLTRKPAQTFLLRGPIRWDRVAGAGLLAICLHPFGIQVATWISQLYPIDEEVFRQLQGFGDQLNALPLHLLLLLVAVLPAICEELTFRGFVLSGLRKAVGPTGAVVLTAVAFGAVHTVLQQSLGAVIIGLVLGFLALRTGSLLPCVIFHAFYNSLSLLLSYYSKGLASESVEGYSPAITVAGLAIGGLLLWWLSGRPVPADERKATRAAWPARG